MDELAGELCDLCGGVLAAQVVDMEFRQGGERIVCAGIPADVCTQCGEEYLSLDILREIEVFMERRQQERPNRYIPVPVYELELAIA